MNSDALRRLEGFLATPDLPALDASPRVGRKALAELNRELTNVFAEIRIHPASEQLIRSLVLLWHDHLEASHALSQDIHTQDGSVLHGIMHRREPDYWNAKYWFNRVGRHAAYPGIAVRARKLLTERDEAALSQRLIPEGNWSPNAFVDACEAVAGSRSVTVPTLQALQEIECRALLEHFCAGPL